MLRKYETPYNASYSSVFNCTESNDQVEGSLNPINTSYRIILQSARQGIVTVTGGQLVVDVRVSRGLKSDEMLHGLLRRYEATSKTITYCGRLYRVSDYRGATSNGLRRRYRLDVSQTKKNKNKICFRELLPGTFIITKDFFPEYVDIPGRGALPWAAVQLACS